MQSQKTIFKTHTLSQAMSCEPQTYTGISLPVLEKIKEKLSSFGLSFEDTSGTVNGPMGVVVDYAWEEAAQTLMIHVTDKPFFVSCDMIYGQVASRIDDVKSHFDNIV